MKTIRTHISLLRNRFKAKSLRGLFAVLLILTLPSQAAAEPAMRERLKLVGPAAAVSFPLLHMVESGALSDMASKVEFALWNNPDQLRALALEGQADFMAMPTNVAANLYNRGVPLRLVNVSVWGILWMVSRNPELKTLSDFKGEEIAVPFRADMPDIVFSYLAEKSGMDPRRDFTVRYTPTPMDAMQLLVMRQVDHALLAEPAVSMALRKTQSFPVSMVAPDLYRSVNLQEEWGRLLGTEARIPQAGVAAVGEARLDEALVDRVEAAYAESRRWCLDNAQDCGALAAKYINMLTPDSVADSIAVLPRHYATVGNKLPDPAFYGPLP